MTDSNARFIDRHYFLLRRIHSFTGIFPIGVFLFPHLTTNSSIIWGEMLTDQGGVKTFQHEVDFIHNLPALILIEWGVLFIPIMIHAGLGIWFGMTGKSNVNRYAYQDNWRYSVQRWSGYLGVLFIFMHITSLRFGWEYGGLMIPFDPDAASSSTAAHFQESPLGLLVPLFYLVAVLALVFHFANGLWTAAITWGLTISAAAQRRWGYVCAVIGVGLSAAAITAIAGFTFLDIEEARAIEGGMDRDQAALVQPAEEAL